MRKKGTFSHLKLSVAKDYLIPFSRRWTVYLGGIAALVFLTYALLNVFLQRSSFISNGPLSSNHANFEGDCSACHTKFSSVTNEKCSVCHEKYGDKLGVYTFAAHYVYRSDDFRRLVPSDNENPCFSCHQEHLGREVAITNVPDSRCLVCHKFGSFEDKHPQFEFARRQIPDNANLKFPHIHHVREVQKRENLLDIEKTCLYCHNPDADGKNFQPISFERHCDACHLTTSTATPWLKIKASQNSKAPGVETLQSMRQQQRPGLRWAFYTHVNEFNQRGDRIRKSPIYHMDPWILENLNSLRRQLYPNSGLVELLRSSGDVPAQDVRQLYLEAIQTLKEYADGLRARPESVVQNELAQINRFLQVVEKQLRDPYTPLDDTKFLLSTLEENPKFTKVQIEEFNEFINKLTEPCQKCHIVSNATILRVQTDQRVFHRAEFNHRVHILQRRCLDCHTQIPILENIANSANIDHAIDNAAIQNIPIIETCKDCHQTKVTSNRCNTCHYFHPNKSQRSNLLLYLD